MQENNSVMEFVLLGLTQDSEQQKMVFAIFFTFYVGTVVGNLLITVTSWTLGNPMWFFHILFVHCWYLFLNFHRLWTNCEFSVCKENHVLQLVSDSGFCTLFIWMHGDFCPCLHGHGSLCCHLQALALWNHHEPPSLCHPDCSCMNRSFIHAMAQIILDLRLPLCGSNLINLYCCDMQPLLKISCMDNFVINLLVVFNSGSICTGSFVVPMSLYIFILHSWWNHSADGRKKVLATCTSHTIVIFLFLVHIYSYISTPTTFPMDKMVAYFILLEHPSSNHSSTHWGIQKWKMLWENYGMSK